MKALIVQSHPSYESFSEAILQVAMSSLEQSGSKVTLVRVGKGGVPLNLDLDKPDLVVFIYPTWWGGYPASLLQWIQEFLLRNQGLLSNAQRVISVTTHGSSKLVNSIQGEWGKIYTERELLPLCKKGADCHWLSLYKIDRQSPEALRIFLDDISDFFLGMEIIGGY
ncbi:MAG: NAD(P)H-dependent oxidoreductase [Acidimicrobiales bacterium]|mgnify:CR=1 FL=1|jgi:putative NADPH-quinone reductase|nr:NAD(P)H-dependent oxidoreductase [Acidimicrobiales bacterium]MDP6298275.1 NAD(P)H-dependent oxidoreductase [Acidimicrobiales bacterium]HJM29087.1 NAD(P)H-dependent oxidoreductase [Acidimicrobiales bacterium]HJM97026.1 NAD(P)H-dependent oxidoreductase [Acidimicrobiales bacterium]